jgi:hypothetical protein
MIFSENDVSADDALVASIAEVFTTDKARFTAEAQAHVKKVSFYLFDGRPTFG